MPDSASNQLVIGGEVGISRDSNADWNISASLSAYLTEALVSTPFIIQPSIKISYTDEFRVWISSGVDLTGDAPHPITAFGPNEFWIKLTPQSEFDYGIPDLSALLLGAANTALNMIEQLTSVQTFLATGLYNPSVGGGWKDVLSELTVPGDWLVHLGVCTYLGTHDSALDFTLSEPTTNNPVDWRGVSAGNGKYNIQKLRTHCCSLQSC